MNSHKINILEFPSNLGLKKTELYSEPGVRYLPEWLRQHGFHERVDPEGVYVLEAPPYAMDLDKETGVRNTAKIIEYAIEQSELVSKYLDDDSFQIVIGGDCSILIGNALALKQKGDFGLFFLDGHTDFVKPELSGTGGAAGMDLAIVTGHGHDKLTNILNQKPYFEERNTFCVGNREYDLKYVQPILESEIGYFDLKKLRSVGPKNTANQFLELVDNHDLSGFFIHADLDVLNDTLMPAVDSRAPDGLTYEEFSDLLKPLLSSKKAFGIEITILDPNLDKSGNYTMDFIEHFVEILNYAKSKS